MFVGYVIGGGIGFLLVCMLFDVVCMDVVNFNVDCFYVYYMIVGFFFVVVVVGFVGFYDCIGFGEGIVLCCIYCKWEL